MTDFTIRKWKRKYPFFKKAMEQGRYLRSLRNADSIQEWVIGRLTPKARDVWDSIMFWQEHREEYERIHGVISTQTEHIRQRVWLHAFVKCKFSMSAACKLTGISYHAVKLWKQNGDFKKMVDEILNMQGDFIEEALMDLVAARDTGAVIFASRTKNRDRGYGDKLDINQTISGTVNVNHTYSMERLMRKLSTGALVELREAYAELKAEDEAQKKLAEPKSNTVDVSVEELDNEDDG
jgi:hypothetical protein